MKKLVALAAVGVLVCGIALALREPSRTFPNANFPATVEIAPVADALTFARVETNGERKLLAVTAYDGDRISGVDLTPTLTGEIRDPIDLFNALGYDALQKRIEDSQDDSLVTVDAKNLVMPVDLTDEHIAAGTNFAAHAEESDVEDGPFLFAKLVTPTPTGAPVAVRDALLDYEVELSFVTLSDTPLPGVPEYMGLILSNDFTDRAKLLRHLDPDNVTSGDGFATGKSAEGYLPVGNLFVIPRDLRAFVSNLELKLAVNGELRQSAPMTLAIWDIDELFRQIQAKQNTKWEHLGEQVRLPAANGTIPKRTLILSGTPAGTVFNGVTNRVMAAGAVRWLFGGWGESVTDNVIESYIARAQRQERFLQPGDTVTIHVNRMGRISTPVVE